MNRLFGLVLFLVALQSAHAQFNVDKLLADAAKKAVANITPLSGAERREVLDVLGPFLERRFSFRENGTASSAHHWNGRVTHIEWMDLKILRLHKDSLTGADRANGLARRYRVSFTCTAHRTWDANQHRWSDWKAVGYPLFPSIIVEERGGVLAVRANEYGEFRPGPTR